MKKQLLFLVALAMTSLLPNGLFAQSTQGTDFWVTLMSGDRGKDGKGKGYDTLSLTFAAKESTKVWLENEYENFKDSVTVGNDTIFRYKLNKTTDYAYTCLVNDDQNEVVSNRALHITAEKPISLIAANYKNKSFDVAAILPTPSLMSEYRIQTYAPSAHEDNSQGSHFAIVAAEDNVVVDITPTVKTKGGKPKDQTFTTDTLKKGQVYYVWTGNGSGINYDFTGSVVKARNNKKIAVFNGNRHTNIPSKIRDRDHIYSQAMPVNYWGKRFAVTSSLTTIDGQDGTYWERIDKIRVQALVDGTVVKIDGVPVHTFDFVNGSDEDKKHFYEFDFGAKDAMNSAENINASKPEKSQYAYKGDGHDYFEGASHYIETSCPSAVHLFMTSNRYDHDKVDGTNTSYCNGDPSLIWVNPIEQKIDTLTFGTFQTLQVQDHFINIVTSADNVSSVRLDGKDISNQFSPLNGNTDYVFARITGVEDRAHTLTADSGFIAHVYGFGEKESYGYPAGGLTKDLTAFITINGVIYRADADNKPICGDDTVHFGAELNYDYDSIYWAFGDGKDTITYQGTDSLPHFYEQAGTYKGAYALIYRHMGEDDGCLNFSAYDSIGFIVNVGTYKVDIKKQHMPECTQAGDEVDFLIYLDNPGEVPLNNDSVRFHFTQTAINDGFTDDLIKVDGDTMLIVHLPKEAKDGVEYGLNLHIGSECPNSTLDKDLTFSLKFAKTVLEQRYKNVLGLAKDSFPNQTLSNFVWFHDGDTIENQITSVLNLEEENPTGEYKVCYTIHEAGKPDYDDCTCPIRFEANSDKHAFSPDSTSLKIEATYQAAVSGGKVFVNADYKGQTDIECYAQWIDASGHIYNPQPYTIPDGGCIIPAPKVSSPTLYLLRVVTGKGSRSFKFLIQ